MSFKVCPTTISSTTVIHRLQSRRKVPRSKLTAVAHSGVWPRFRGNIQPCTSLWRISS